MDFSDSGAETGLRIHRRKRRKAYCVRNPDGKGSPFLFPPQEQKIEGTPPNGEKITRNIEESWRKFQPKGPEGEMIDRYAPYY